MTIVRVTYIAKPEFVETNKGNIRQVMADLNTLNHPGLFYTTCLSPDGKTFTHTAFFRSDDDRKVLNELPAFKTFQEQLKAHGLETQPNQEFLSLVGASRNIFEATADSNPFN